MARVRLVVRRATRASRWEQSSKLASTERPASKKVTWRGPNTDRCWWRRAMASL